MHFLAIVVFALSGSVIAAPTMKRAHMDYYDDDDFSMASKHGTDYEDHHAHSIVRKDEATRGGTIYRKDEATRGGTIYRKDEQTRGEALSLKDHSH
ncbi:hypothetical protein GE09DRAFT_1225670 [Coniochaeta sp. 2T2.1]|nr:hypothetical protein GE09DRAFT_1225670 [Coniochaeta sp. 2T2.1]